MQMCCVDRSWAQAPTSQSLGSLRATGETSLNGTPATGDQTLYSGDTVRTGTNGAAVLTSPNVGSLVIPAESEISFGASPFLAMLKQGSVEVRTLPSGGNLSIQFGNTLMSFASSDSPSAGVITLHPDGSAMVSCGLGSVVLRTLSGAELMTLRSGQFVAVGADGKLQNVQSGTPIPNASAPASTAKSPRTAYIVLGVAAAGGTAAAVALIANKSSAQPVSPSSP
jgi:hypothetical protein